MYSRDLKAIDVRLDPKVGSDLILINKWGYFLYYNEPNKKVKDVKVHIYNCGFCAFGSGRDATQEPGRNGVWIGPFSSKEQADNFATLVLNISTVSSHSCCNH
jgi:hypothetical protein